MDNRMQQNFNTMKHPMGNLKESVDAIRSSVKDLYELDEDNYQMIRNLQKALDEANNRYNRLTKRFNHVRKLTAVGLLALGIGGMLVSKIVDKHDAEISNLEADIKVLKDLYTQEKEQESDG